MTAMERRRAAGRVAARSQIRDVRLMSSTAELMSVPEDDRPLDVEFNLDPVVDWNDGDSLFIVECKCSLDLTQAAEAVALDDEAPQASDESSPTPTQIASMSFTMSALFELELREGDEAATVDELSAYAETTGTFALYPFVREYVYDVTGRLRLPPLTLGVYLLPSREAELT